jgi:hypothetical protein
MKELSTAPVTVPQVIISKSELNMVKTNPLITQAIDNLCMVLSICGEKELSDDMIQEIKLKMKSLKLRDSVTVK